MMKATTIITRKDYHKDDVIRNIDEDKNIDCSDEEFNRVARQFEDGVVERK